MSNLIIFSLLLFLLSYIAYRMMKNNNSLKYAYIENNLYNDKIENYQHNKNIIKVSSVTSDIQSKRKFVIGKGPFIRSTDEGINSTTRMMVDVMIALCPIILFAWYKNGIKPFVTVKGVSILVMLWPLLFVIIGGLTSFILEALYFCLFMGVKELKGALKSSWDSYSILPGLFLALILPLYTPIWVLMFGCLISNIVFKMLFGGFGHNIFNPALIGYAFIMAAFSGSTEYLNPSEIYDIASGSTPLAVLSKNLGSSYQDLVGNYGNLWNYFIGTIPGSLGETSALLCIIAFIYLSVRKTINWYVPTIYIGTVFCLSWIIGAVNGQPGIWYPTFNILTGGLMFGAVFMATEPVTSPKTSSGKVIFAIFLGLFTTLFRFVGAMNEGVATSILFMCLFSNVIDRFTAQIRSSVMTKKNVLKIVFVIFLMLAIGGYTIYKCIPGKESTSGLEFYSIISNYIGKGIR